MSPRSYYEVLGVARDASADDIRRAYRRLARQHHPDVSANRDARARFDELSTAYQVLHDPQRRARYDRTIAGIAEVVSRRAARDVPRFLDQTRVSLRPTVVVTWGAPGLRLTVRLTRPLRIRLTRWL